MGLIEIIGEMRNPGKTGTIDITKRKRDKHIGMLIVKTIVSLTILFGLYYLSFGMSFQIKGFLTYLLIMAAYSIMGYFVMPRPDYSNVGWLGGLFDNPFKISDDFNRMLIFVAVLLMPGRLISTTVVSWITIRKE